VEAAVVAAAAAAAALVDVVVDPPAILLGHRRVSCHCPDYSDPKRTAFSVLHGVCNLEGQQCFQIEKNNNETFCRFGFGFFIFRV
jgi:hypothetical protein